ncbi:MAG: alkaline phosphatase [Bacteroidetes bacterium]|mgnify:CR=1 FL=1|nr:alkaline phosphatase [Bacteroidota bacterium]
MKKLIYCFFALLILASCQQIETQTESAPKNVILLIGDGMGIAQISVGYFENNKQIHFQRCKHTGFSITYSADYPITDSGAAGTALATGYKTNNGMIGMDADSVPVQSILHYAVENGKATALVASSTVVHATPASFIAHNISRYNYEELAEDYLKTDIDIFIGGGLNYFNNRKDSVDLVSQLKAKDYQIVTKPADLEAIKSGKLAGLMYPDHPPKYIDGRGDMLIESSMKAIELMKSNENGYFMMIESSQIDWAGHDNSSEYLVGEMLDFDKTVGAILDYAEKDGNTLVIITADHETGGVILPESDERDAVMEINFGAAHHTATMVPVFAFGPGADQFTGIMDNTDIFKKMYSLMGFDKK